MKICLQCEQRFDSRDWRCPSCSWNPVKKGQHIQFAPELAEANGGFKPEHFAELAAVEGGHFWFRNRNRLITWGLQRYFPNLTNFMEIGCGTGFVLAGIRQAFSGAVLTGAELFSQGLEFACKRVKDAALYQMDATRLPFEAEFDCIGAFDVLEHIEEDETVLGQIYKALKPQGGFLATVPQHPSLWSAADVSACHKRRYTKNELAKKVTRAGFKVLRLTSFVTLLLPLFWAARKKAHGTGSIESNREFHLGKQLNHLLEEALRLESAFIRRGINFPCGGSLFLVALKP